MASEKDEKKPTGPSKFPDLKEVGGMAGKLFSDVKTSITEIIKDYKKKRPEAKTEKPKTEKKASKDKE